MAGDVDLVELLHDALNRTFERGPTRWELTVSPPGARAELADEVSVQAFRIVQEALLNVRRHARAEHVGVTVRPDATGVEIEVTDDGVGLDAPALEPRARSPRHAHDAGPGGDRRRVVPHRLGTRRRLHGHDPAAPDPRVRHRGGGVPDPAELKTGGNGLRRVGVDRRSPRGGRGADTTESAGRVSPGNAPEERNRVVHTH